LHSERESCPQEEKREEESSYQAMLGEKLQHAREKQQRLEAFVVRTTE
jgi:hypothetical protein